MAFAIHTDALIALAAAASWGGGDFSGGMGVKAAGGRTSGALRIVIVAHGISLAALLAILWLQHAPLPHGALLGWGLLAGVASALSLTAFYIALSRGAMGASAAVSGLLAAAIPVVVSSAIEGAPTALRLAGFALAAAAIWMIAAGTSPENVDGAKQRGTMALAICGGLGFGFYFVALRMDNPLGILEPLALARLASVVTCVLLLLAVRLWGRKASLGGGGRLSRTALIWALGVAVLDSGGNLLFVAATRMGRLDVAAVLASLYPAATILLAAWKLHERPTRRQFAGMAVALAAVLMITL
jgi:drug/metabolite transporter (DMT)-like permease